MKIIIEDKGKELELELSDRSIDILEKDLLPIIKDNRHVATSAEALKILVEELLKSFIRSNIKL